MKSILIAIKKWHKGQDFWFYTTSVNPVCYSPWWVTASIKGMGSDCPNELYRTFWARRLS